MSTNLQMCKDVCREAGVAKGEDAITAVSGQVGDLQRIVKYVQKEWEKIQSSNSGMWRWMRITAEITASASDGVYAPTDFTDTLTNNAVDRFSRWRADDIEDPPKAFLSSAGVGAQYWLSWMPWDTFKSIYRIGTQNDSQPAHISIDPQDNIVVSPVPAAATVIQVDYYRSPQIITADGDIPEMPVHYHDLIVFRALEQYGIYKIKKEAIYKGEKESRKLMRQLKTNQLPRIRMGAPLA